MLDGVALFSIILITAGALMRGQHNEGATMINRLLFKLTARLPCRLIKPDGKAYLERYFVGQLFGVTIYLHRFVSADSERHLHNHPWNRGLALILSGSYIEETVRDICPHAGRSGCVTSSRRQYWWNAINGNKFHRISAAAPGTWTLFMHGKRAMVDHGMATQLKGWGFLEQGYALGFHQVTLFHSYEGSGNLEWWHKAPKGQDAGREWLR